MSHLCIPLLKLERSRETGRSRRRWRSVRTRNRRVSPARSPRYRMVYSPASRSRSNVPFWTTVAVAALYLPASVVARALTDPAYATAIAWLPRSLGGVAGTSLGTVLAAALWLPVAGGFLYAFAAELATMRDRTAWSPPDKGYLVLATGSLLAHPLTGRPFVFLVIAGYTLHRTLRVR